METPRVYSYSRFSSPEQAKGHSLERQVQRAREWAEARGLVLEDELSDLGLSAFHADHLKTGALGRFVALVEAGKIPPGSILLVEQLDRLTRESLHNAQGLLWRILDAGIRVVTLVDDEEYTREQGIGAVIKMLVALEASHQESSKKSDRLRESWKKRAARAEAGEVISKRVPGHLKVVDKKIIVIPDRAEVLKEMFTMAAEGMGITSIAGRLNKRGEPTWGPGRSWRRTVVYQMLTSPAAVGTLQLDMFKDKRDIEGYYPAVVDKALFQRVQRSLSAKTFGGGSSRAGRNAGYTNLISGIGFCAECGSRMAIINAGPKNGGHRLVCDDARLGRGCKYVSLLYGPVEDAILRYCSEVDLTRLTGGTKEPELEAARAEVQSLRHSMEDRKAQVEAELALSALVKSPEMLRTLAERLDSLQKGLDDTKLAIEEAERKVERLSRSGDVVIEHLEAVRKLKDEMQDGDEATRIEIRRKLRFTLANAIERIDFFPEGYWEKGVPIFNDKKGIVVADYTGPDFKEEFPEDVRNLFEIVPKSIGREHAAFLVQFRNGHARLFRWSQDEQRFLQEMTATATGKAYTVSGKGLVREEDDKGFGGIKLKKGQKGA